MTVSSRSPALLPEDWRARNDEIARLREQGKTFAEIARLYGISRARAHQIASRAGAHPRVPPRLRDVCRLAGAQPWRIRRILEAVFPGVSSYDIRLTDETLRAIAEHPAGALFPFGVIDRSIRPKYRTVQSFARAVGASIGTVRRRIAEGVIASERFGGVVVIPVEAEKHPVFRVGGRSPVRRELYPEIDRLIEAGCAPAEIARKLGISYYQANGYVRKRRRASR